MRESRTYGSVRGAPSNRRPYRARLIARDDEAAGTLDIALSPAPEMMLSRATEQRESYVI